MLVNYGRTSPSIALTRRFRSHGCCAMRVVSFTLNQAAQTHQWEDRHNINVILGDIGSHETAMETPNTKMCTLIFFSHSFELCSATLPPHSVLIWPQKPGNPTNGFPRNKNAQKSNKMWGYLNDIFCTTSKLQQLQYVSSSSKKAP